MPVLRPDPRYFPAAVESILAQTVQDFELIIVEDPSERSAEQMLQNMPDSRIRHVRNPRRTSFVDQLNQGLDMAEADWVARFDADDLCATDRLEKQWDYLKKHPEIGLLGCQLKIIGPAGEQLGFRSYPVGHEAVLQSLRLYSALAHPSVIYRRRDVLEAGGYRLREFPTDDYELWSRLARRGVRIANHPEALVSYRIHPQGMKAQRVRDFVMGTLAVKRMHWCDPGNWRVHLRMGLERTLLLLPPKLVYRLFTFTQYSKRLRSK